MEDDDDVVTETTTTTTARTKGLSYVYGSMKAIKILSLFSS